MESVAAESILKVVSHCSILEETRMRRLEFPLTSAVASLRLKLIQTKES